jgi:chromosome segregation ATPase
MTLRIDNKELMSQVESLQMRLAGAAKMETLACDMRLTIDKERQLCEELVAEKERTLNLELEIKDLQHKMDAMHASSQEQRDLQQISDDIREMVSSSRDSVAELLEEKERSLSLHVDNATMRREIELMREYSKDQEGKLETVLGEINQLGANFEGARSLASDLLVEKERAAQLLAENVSLRQQVIASCLTFFHRAPGYRGTRPAEPVLCPDIPSKRQGPRLSREPSKEAVDIQGSMLGAGSAGVATS